MPMRWHEAAELPNESPGDLVDTPRLGKGMTRWRAIALLIQDLTPCFSIRRRALCTSERPSIPRLSIS